MEHPVIIRPRISPGRRIIAVSDIHGNLPFFRRLMEKVCLTPEDVLVLVGDMLEKGEHSLPLLRHLMALSRTHTLYPLSGNCDSLVLRFFQSEELDGRFFSSYLPQHPESTLRQLAREGGFDQTDDLPASGRTCAGPSPRSGPGCGACPPSWRPDAWSLSTAGSPP